MPHDFQSRAEELKDAVVGWRRHFHSHPELSFSETETSRYIAEQLTHMGCENVTIGTRGREVGVIADITGGYPGRRVALRADIDALPVCEATGLDFTSQNAGVMHACGHDGHMAMLLGAARMLCEIKEQLHGSVRLIFQPSEEASEFYQGALAVLEDGKALDGVDAIFGVHLWSPLAAGKFGWTDGPIMACSDRWNLRILGKGGHGAMPHQTHDPVIALGQIITGLQTFVSRETDPMQNAVLSTCYIKAGNGAFNVIPTDIEVSGTVRSFSRDLSLSAESFIRRVTTSVCEAFRCTAEVSYTRNLPPTINHADMAALGCAAAKDIFGENNVTRVTPVMAGEDFGYYLEKIPGAFFFIGVGDESKGTNYPHHHAHFTIDEAQLAKGAAFEATCAWNFLNEN